MPHRGSPVPTIVVPTDLLDPDPQVRPLRGPSPTRLRPRIASVTASLEAHAARRGSAASTATPLSPRRTIGLHRRWAHQTLQCDLLPGFQPDVTGPDS